MGLNEVASSERVHIGFFGMRNAGKSSVVNSVTGQDISIVSDIKGTTTDPVKKAMELLPLGPVVIIDTPGLDDEGELGRMRVLKAKRVLEKIDIAILIIAADKGRSLLDDQLISEFKEKNIPYILVYNKSDLIDKKQNLESNEIYVSAINNENIFELKNMIGRLIKQVDNKKYIIANLIDKGDTVILVTPIDESAPKGRLILPQQLVLREILDFHCVAVVCQHQELKNVLSTLSSKPRMVITDSQVFKIVNKDVPNDIPLTSFSILFARYKGFLNILINGAKAISNLKTGDKVLISEGCTHHRQCNDIGTVQFPKMIEKYTGFKLIYEFSSGQRFPSELSDYKLIIHCGGCMINEKEMAFRISKSKEYGVPIVNYGIAIAYMSGILERSVALLK